MTDTAFSTDPDDPRLDASSAELVRRGDCVWYEDGRGGVYLRRKGEINQSARMKISPPANQVV